jgi:hypothetical protein
MLSWEASQEWEKGGYMKVSGIFTAGHGGGHDCDEDRHHRHEDRCDRERRCSDRCDDDWARRYFDRCEH